MKHSIGKNILGLGTVAFILTGCVFGENKQFFESSSVAGSQANAGKLNPFSSVAGGGIGGVLPSPAPLIDPTPAPPLIDTDICVANPTAPACVTAPVVTTPGVVTILFTMSQIPQESGALILANAVKYASPVSKPKILFLKDSQTHGEDEGDPAYIQSQLLSSFDVEYGVIAPGGLLPSDVEGKDLVIVSNPGHPLSDQSTLNTLMSFQGGVILIGDDMGSGAGFATEPLTGLSFRNNGTSMSCNGHSYNYDNLQGSQYQVSMNDEFLPGIPDQFKNYQYGNDLDWTVANPGVQVLAWAAAAPGTCDIGFVPAIARHAR